MQRFYLRRHHGIRSCPARGTEPEHTANEISRQEDMKWLVSWLRGSSIGKRDNDALDVRVDLNASKMTMRPEQVTEEHRDPCLVQTDCRYDEAPRQEFVRV